MSEKIEKVSSKVEVIQPKLCPLISGFLIEPIKTALGEIKAGKTTNINPCIQDKCMFYDVVEKKCLIYLYLLRSK